MLLVSSSPQKLKASIYEVSPASAVGVLLAGTISMAGSKTEVLAFQACFLKSPQSFRTEDIKYRLY